MIKVIKYGLSILLILTFSTTIEANHDGHLLYLQCKECHTGSYSRIQTKIDSINAESDLEKIIESCKPYHDLIQFDDHKTHVLYEYLKNKK